MSARRNHAQNLAIAVALSAGCNAIFGIEEPDPSVDSGRGGSAGTLGAGGDTGDGGTSAEGGDGANASTGGDGAGGGGASGDCGNGLVDSGENCDDENSDPGDGCSGSCRIESGWDCDQGEPTHCSAICGDGLLVGPEAEAGGCDDENELSDDGCSASCEVEPGFVCINEPSDCAETCGNSSLDAGETCDDGNLDAGDGCDACAIEPNFLCDNSPLPSTCSCKVGYTLADLECVRTSCVGLAAECGQTGNSDCCASPVVSGGSFTMGTATNATIADFALDKFEATVGRFKRFVDAYAGPPAAGAGAHPLIVDSGWQSAWDAQLPANAAAVPAAVQCSSDFQTWSASAANDFLPINCLSWYMAFAFCIWDGGRLPTEAEWEYAAAGGNLDLTYPWGDSPALTDLQDTTTVYANYFCLGNGDSGFPQNFCQPADILRVGSKPDGIGQYEQLDLIGSVYEWVLDLYDPVLPATCDNCANLSSGAFRGNRGGGWMDEAIDDFSEAMIIRSEHRNSSSSIGTYHGGVRCARAP